MADNGEKTQKNLKSAENGSKFSQMGSIPQLKSQAISSHGSDFLGTEKVMVT